MDREPEAFAPIVHARIAQGDVFWLPPDPARGAVPGAPHPHVVIQDDLFNRSRIATVVVCALSTHPARAAEPGNVALEPGEGGLPRRSTVVVSQISCVYKARLGERIGALSPQRVEQILAGLRFVEAAFQR